MRDNIPDNLDLFKRHDAEQSKQIKEMPQCDYCNEYIQDEYLYLINDEPVCKSCIADHFKKAVEDYVG